MPSEILIRDRRSAMARYVRSEGPVAVMILGASHNLRKFMLDDTQYLRVTVQSLPGRSTSWNLCACNQDMSEFRAHHADAFRLWRPGAGTETHSLRFLVPAVGSLYMWAESLWAPDSVARHVMHVHAQSP